MKGDGGRRAETDSEEGGKRGESPSVMLVGENTVAGILMGLCLCGAAFDHALRLHADVGPAGNRHLVTLWISAQPA